MKNFQFIIILSLIIASCGESTTKENHTNKNIAKSDTVISSEKITDSISDKKNVADTILILERDKNGKFGYKDSSNRWIIEPQFNLAGEFGEKLAPVLIKEEWKLINKKGEAVFDFKKVKPIVIHNELSGEDHVIPITEKTLAIEFADGKQGFLKLFNGKFTAKFDEVYSFSNGRAAIRQGEKWGFITIDGKFLVKPKYDRVMSFSDNRAIVEMDGISGIIDENNKIISPLRYKDAFRFQEGLTFVTEEDGYTGYFIIDVNGKVVNKGPFESVYNRGFENGECEVMKNGKCIVIYKNGNKIRENKKGCQEGC